MTRPRKRGPANSTLEPYPVPPPEQWQAPMAWRGSPPSPDPESLTEFREDASFVRAELSFTLSEPRGEGVYSQTFPHKPGLIRLDRANVVEVHFGGFEGKCWTYRLQKEGRKKRWGLFTGEAFPAADPVEEPCVGAAMIDYVYVQSLVPMSGTRKYVNFMIRQDGSMEVLSRFTSPQPEEDPDPEDA